MESRKKPIAELESKKPLFFLSGVAIALISVITALQWKVEADPIVAASLDSELTYIPFDIPATRPTMPEMPKPKESYKPSSNLINIGEPEPELDTTKLVIPNTGTGLIDSLIEIDVDSTDLMLGTTPVPAFQVERMAVPMSCKDLLQKDQQWECLNSWLARYISENMTYPNMMARMGYEGTVYVYFVISKEGQIEDIEVKRGEYESFNEEAVDVLSTLPKFRPAIVGGKPVRMSMTIPVRFRLY